MVPTTHSIANQKRSRGASIAISKRFDGNTKQPQAPVVAQERGGDVRNDSGHWHTPYDVMDIKHMRGPGHRIVPPAEDATWMGVAPTGAATRSGRAKAASGQQRHQRSEVKQAIHKSFRRSAG